MNTIENPAEKGIVIVKFGGSFATDPNTGIIKRAYFRDFFKKYGQQLEKYEKVGSANGGGKKVRDDQRKYRNLRDRDLAARDRMWGNAELIRQIASDYSGLRVADRVPHSVAELMKLTHDPEINAVFGSWTQEGWDSSYTAFLLLKGFLDALKETDKKEEIDVLVMFLSNLYYMGREDPRINPFTQLVEESNLGLLLKAKIASADVANYSPGTHVPIGPHAVRDLHKLEKKRKNMMILYTHGGNLLGIKSALEGKRPERATILSPGISDTVWKENDSHNPAKS